MDGSEKERRFGDTLAWLSGKERCCKGRDLDALRLDGCGEHAYGAAVGFRDGGVVQIYWGGCCIEDLDSEIQGDEGCSHGSCMRENGGHNDWRDAVHVSLKS